MVEGKKGAHFSHKGMTLFLPSHSVSSLEIEDSDQLLLTLTNSEEYGFFLNITLNGQELTHISEMKIMVPYKAESSSHVLHLIDDSKKNVALGTYDPENGVATFLINQTGQYTILEEAAEVSDLSSFQKETNSGSCCLPGFPCLK